MIVDTLGLIVAVTVHAASVQDRDGAKLLLDQLGRRWRRLQLIWADGAYAGRLIDWTWRQYRRTLQIVKRSDSAKGFEVLAKRWIVERTFGWFGSYRRLSKDYETLTESSEAMIYLSMIHLMVRRLRPRHV